MSSHGLSGAHPSPFAGSPGSPGPADSHRRLPDVSGASDRKKPSTGHTAPAGAPANFAPPPAADVSERPRAAVPQAPLSGDVEAPIQIDATVLAPPPAAPRFPALINGARVLSQAITWGAGMAFSAEGAKAGFTLGKPVEKFGGVVAVAGLIGLAVGPIAVDRYMTYKGRPPQPAPRLGHAVKWAVAAVLAGVSSGVAVTYMEKYRQREMAHRDFDLLALSDVPHPFPREDIKNFLVVSPSLVTNNSFAVADYIKYGRVEDLNKIIAISNSALTRLTQDPDILPALPHPLSSIRIPVIFAKSLTGIYQANGVLSGSKDTPVTCELTSTGMQSSGFRTEGETSHSPIDPRSDGEASQISLQKVDWLSVLKGEGQCISYKELFYCVENQGESGGCIGEPFRKPSDGSGKPEARSELYKYIKPDAALEVALTPVIFDSLKSKHFLRTYNATGGKIPAADIKYEIISQLAAQALAKAEVSGVDRRIKYFDIYEDEFVNDAFAFYKDLLIDAIRPPIGFGTDSFATYFKNGTSIGPTYFSDALGDALQNVTLSTAYRSLLDTSKEGRKASEALVAAIPEMYVKQPVPTPGPT
jgi:hypothetical protein